MSTKSQARALLLAAVVPAMLVTGCAAGGTNMRLTGAVASPTPPMPSESGPTPAESETGMTSPMPTESGTMSPEPSGTEMTSPRAAVQAYFDAAKAGDADKAADAFTSDGMAAIAGKPTADGTEALRKLFEDEFKAKAERTHTFDETRTFGSEAAFVRTTSKEGDETYREFFLLKKADGEWKIDRFMDNEPT
ncbi:nuclear transport factor 2 family protein [Nonomuraea sp. NPDC026600]|uniref:nuclear transport factor 2 family protein n=1 Tax=Nonomuraea sp. NPDC026600 TaxID=3155363 RepID=UPI0033EADBAA